MLGSNNEIGPYTIISGKTIIGNNNVIGSHVILGCDPTDTKFIARDESARLLIGNNNIIREFSLVELPCYEESTIIGNDAFLMQGVHVSHDVHVKDKAVITNTSVIAGLVKILDGANIAMACTINQYTVIGHYSIAATNAAVMKNIKPFSKYIPNKPLSVNKYALSKFGFNHLEEEISDYVLHDIPVKNCDLKRITDEFDYWVLKYGHETYK